MTTEQNLREALDALTNGNRTWDAIRILRGALGQATAPEQQAPQGEERYFAYDPEGGGAELFQSLDGAMRFANESLQCHRDDAQHDGEWPEGVDRVCVGVITHVAAAKGSESEGVDYEMAPLAASPAAPEAAKPETERAEFEVDELESIIEKYVDGYEFDFGEGVHYPTEFERTLIKDALIGLLGNEQWDAAWGNQIHKQAALLSADSKAGGEVAVMSDEEKSAVKIAYGHLWHVNNEPFAPISIYDTEKAAYEARRQLRGLLTDKERGEAINYVGHLIGRYETGARENAELVVDSNSAKPEQQRELASAVALGQSVGGGRDSKPSNLKTQRMQHVATVVDVDEYGPMLEWTMHWVELIGAKLYTRPQQQAKPLKTFGDAVAWIERRRDEFLSENSSTDPETGAVEFGRGARATAAEEYVFELDQIIEGLRAHSIGKDQA